MQCLPRTAPQHFAFDWRVPAALTVDADEVFVVETEDASSGYFRTPADLAIPAQRPGFNRVPPLANPIAGPIALRGAASGQTLAVSIVAIEVGDYSWTAIGPNRGPLGDSARFSELSTRYTTKIFPHVAGQVVFSDRLRWPITPFIGTLGVAPDREVATSLDGQGAWGGNLDVRDFAPGNCILLPIYHPGGLLYVGDVHASQGDTEFTGTAAETRASVRLRLSTQPGPRVPGVRIRKPDSIVTVAADRPLEMAVHTATVQLMDWLIVDFGYSATDAYCLVSVCPDFRIHVYQMCRIGKLSFVAGAELPSRYLSTP
jgi:acetamidase/formamidase